MADTVPEQPVTMASVHLIFKLVRNGEYNLIIRNII